MVGKNNNKNNHKFTTWTPTNIESLDVILGSDAHYTIYRKSSSVELFSLFFSFQTPTIKLMSNYCASLTQNAD